MLPKRLLHCLLLLTLSFGLSQAQNTIGVTIHDESKAQLGYNLLFPADTSAVFLLDNCGRKVHEWTDDFDQVRGNSVYLMPNGDLVKAKRHEDRSNDPIWAGGGGATIERVDWDNNLLWSWTWNDSTGRLHHDMAVMPNGNVLAIAWGHISGDSAIAAGRDTSFLTEGELWPLLVLELEPDGQGSANVVWQWNIMDHVVQDYDSTKANYGVVADHPELADLNFGNAKADWVHTNAIDYNPDLDQIVLSPRAYSEIWIIDHSTTTAEAASHSGGNAGKGGDLIYRWGHPEAYDRGDSTDQMLFKSHDIHWIDLTVGPGENADYGKMMVYNNQAGSDYSEVNVFSPVWNTSTNEYEMVGNTYGPASFDDTFVSSPPQYMYSNFISGAQRLDNGNTLICNGRHGHVVEMTPAYEIVWEYRCPIQGGAPVAQGDSIPSGNTVFRMNRYPADYYAFVGRTLMAGDYLELNPDTTQCNLPILDAAAPTPEGKVLVYPNPATDVLFIAREKGTPAQLEVIDMMGHIVRDVRISGITDEISLDGLADGLYFVRLNKHSVAKVFVER